MVAPVLQEYVAGIAYAKEKKAADAVELFAELVCVINKAASMVCIFEINSEHT